MLVINSVGCVCEGLLLCSVVADYDAEQFAGENVPILVVGTKEDLISAVREGHHRGNGMDEAGAEAVNVVCISFLISDSDPSFFDTGFLN